MTEAVRGAKRFTQNAMEKFVFDPDPRNLPSPSEFLRDMLWRDWPEPSPRQSTTHGEA
ncbi:MAG: hypothetical protein LC676_16510 [Loktanella sp.]|nr:hypothetical protein [Loktanella sp.]